MSLANNMSELINEIDDTLINPDRRQKERNELCEKMMPNLPTSELIEESIKQLL